VSEATLADVDVDAFWEKGYVIIPEVFTREEIDAFRASAKATQGAGGDLLVNPRLKSVLLDGRLVDVAKRLLGTDDVLYLGDSSFTINAKGLGWHKDNTDRFDPKAPDWASRYTQLRFGIYCQDHSEHTAGLNLKVGSHDIPPDRSGGKTIYVKSRPGDLVVWSMRMTHSGNGMLLKDPEAPFPEPNEQKFFSPEEVAPVDGDRIAIFVHLGANDSHGKRYGDYLKTRTYMVDAWRKRPFDAAVLEEAKDAGLNVRDLPAEVMNDPTAGQNEDWKPFPYPKPAEPAPAAHATASGAAPVSVVTRGRKKAKRVALAARRRLRGTVKGAYQGWKDSAR
jgi:hypothetical protein